MLCCSARAVVTKCHKAAQIYWLPVLEARDPKSECWQGCIPSGCPGKRLPEASLQLLAYGSITVISMWYSPCVCASVSMLPALIGTSVMVDEGISKWPHLNLTPAQNLFPNHITFSSVGGQNFNVFFSGGHNKENTIQWIIFDCPPLSHSGKSQL